MGLFLQLLCVAIAVTNTTAHDPIHQALVTSRNNETVLVVNAVPVQHHAGDAFWSRLTSGRAHRKADENAAEHDANDGEFPYTAVASAGQVFNATETYITSKERERARVETPRKERVEEQKNTYTFDAKMPPKLEMTPTKNTTKHLINETVPTEMDMPQGRKPRISDKENYLEIIDARTVIEALWAESSNQAQARSSSTADSNTTKSVYLGPVWAEVTDETVDVDEISGSLHASPLLAALEEAVSEPQSHAAEALDTVPDKALNETAAVSKDPRTRNFTTEVGVPPAGAAGADEGSVVPEGRRASLAYTIRPLSLSQEESSGKQATKRSADPSSLETRDPFGGELAGDSFTEFSIKPTAVEDGGHFDPAEFGLDFSSVEEEPRPRRNWNCFWSDKTTYEDPTPQYPTQYGGVSSAGTPGPDSLEQAIARALEGQSVLRSGMGDFDVLVTPVDRAMVRSVIETRALCNLWAQSGACSCRKRICRRWTAYVRRTCPEVCMEEESTASTIQKRALGGVPRLSDLIRSLPQPALTLLQQMFSAPGIDIRTRCAVAGSLLGRVKCRASTPYVAHPFFCECFYSCEGSKKHLHVCPAGKHYSTDKTAKLCVEPAKARCRVRKPVDSR